MGVRGRRVSGVITDCFALLPAVGDDREAFKGRWEDRLWLNVPGPLYGAETDTCRTGRLHAPAHGRARIAEYLTRRSGEWGEFDARSEQGLVAAVRDFEAYVADGLATDLRVYLYRLEERRAPGDGDRLPVLCGPGVLARSGVDARPACSEVAYSGMACLPSWHQAPCVCWAPSCSRLYSRTSS
ncbi:hypothetical protein [Streptomyces sp. MB09-02B]|uniref:hypothetical protein n=1 Tax=Streptomyces sp. MB09-02B TaxID=3028667 RepID=UPI0029B4D038|nr:hypothetical protein [Streptomyces sp. MB09-02B]MDX3639457.1 hypothetical protein [Streptomyces sp. MB09-02B]